MKPKVKSLSKLAWQTLEKAVSIFLFSQLCIAASYAQFEAGDPRKAPEITICSQNLENFGNYEDSKARNSDLSPAKYEQKIVGLIKRFQAASCDVVAVQEIVGKGEKFALAALQSLAQRLTALTGRPYEARVSSEGDVAIRNGFLVALDRCEILNVLFYGRMELPRLLETQKPKIFDRAPVELQVRVKGQDEAEGKVVSILNFHLKSRAGAAQDPTGLQFETTRMEMAEGLRRLIDLRHSAAFVDPSKILVVLGDRNTDAPMAAAKILEGTLALTDFRTDGPCRLSKRGVPICKTEVRRPQKLFSVLTTDPQTKGVAGSYFYNDEASWIDDIMMPQLGLRYALGSVFVENDYDSGTVSKPSIASDHSLVFVRLNW